MTGKEISDIIASCAQANVKVIELPGLRLDFGDGATANPPTANPNPSKPTSPTVAALTAEQHKRQNDKSLELEEALAKEERLSLMLIEDPYGYEQLVLKGELFEAADGDEEFE